MSRFSTADGGVLDTETGLIWLQDASQMGKMPWAKAMAACAAIGAGWRLPTVKELLTLVDYERSNPAISEEAVAVFSGVLAHYYWSSTSRVSNPSSAWYVSLYRGYVTTNGKTTALYVWPVRDGGEDE